MALTKVGNIVNESPGGRNVIINGDFNIWQRGTNFSPIATGGYGPDRFQYAKTGSMVHNCSRSAVVPTLAQSDHQSNYSLYTIVSTIDASISDTDYASISYKVEGYDFVPLVGKTCNFSFWVRAYKTGTYCVSFRNSAANRSYVVEYTVNVSDTWEKKSFVIPFLETGTWDYTNGIGLRILWCMGAGSTWQTTANTWQDGNYLGTSNQVNACDSTSNTFRLSQVQLEVGVTATDFECRDISTELALCQRYFEKSYDIGTAPGSITPTGAAYYRAASAITVGYGISWERFHVSKRTNPSIVLYSYSTGASGKLRDQSVGADRTGSGYSPAHNGFIVLYGDATGVSDQSRVWWHWTADAEL